MWKRKKKKRIDDLVQSQKGALDNFFKKELLNDKNMNHISNTFVDDPIDNDINIDHNVRINENSNVVDDIKHVNVVNDDIDEDIEHVFDANIDDDAFVNENTDYNVDIFDPRNWDGLDSQMIDILVVNGPKRKFLSD